VNDSEMDIIFEMMGSKLSRFGQNKSAKCPLAPWTHRSGADKSPSLTAKTGTPALFRCWACGEAGTVRKLTKLYASHSGDQRPYEFLKSVEGNRANHLEMPISAARGGYGSSKKRYGNKIKEELAKIITEEVVQKFSEEIPNYAFERGMTKSQVLKWEIGFDPVEKRMIFPIRDHMGKLFGVSGRDLTGEVKNKYKHYPGLKKEKLFYGEKFIDRNCRTIRIVEGFFDVIGLEREGVKNVFASMGTSLSFDQLKKIRDWSDEVIFFPDGDLAGVQFAEEFAHKIFVQLGKRVGIAGVELNPGYIKRDIPTKQWQDSDFRFRILEKFIKKDPSDWGKEGLARAMASVGTFHIRQGGIVHEVEDWTR
jgi:DNA primase